MALGARSLGRGAVRKRTLAEETDAAAEPQLNRLRSAQIAWGRVERFTSEPTTDEGMPGRRVGGS